MRHPSGHHETPSPEGAVDARLLVDRLLRQAVQARASDIHLEPEATGFEVRWRVDGMLRTMSRLDPASGRSAVIRLMVMADLLTYRLDVPQEGRLSAAVAIEGEKDRLIDLRLAVMPTTHGLRAVVRLPADVLAFRALDDLALPDPVVDALTRFARADQGLLLLVGPAGAGKTTTIYCLLDHIARRQPGLSIVALEDPVERDLPGVTQIQVNPFGELTYDKALRSILRQDPQVLMLGEIRDAATASIALQAALSGHRLISTLHAADPAGAIARLLDMGLEPYQVTSALYGVVAQRLLRRREASGEYRGRAPIAEFAPVTAPLRQAVLDRADAETLRRIIREQPGYETMRQAARHLIEQGVTDQEEVERVLGAD